MSLFKKFFLFFLINARNSRLFDMEHAKRESFEKIMRQSFLNSGSIDFLTFRACAMSVRVSPLPLLINIQHHTNIASKLRGGGIPSQPWLFFRRATLSNFMVNLCLRGRSGGIRASQHACIKAFRQLPESRPASDGRAV